MFQLISLVRARVSLCVLVFVTLATPQLRAGSASWDPNPIDGDWNNNGNWTPATAPNGPSDTATFNSSSVPNLFLSANTEVDGMIFNPNASAYTIKANPAFTLTLSGVGITNNSGIMQNFVADVNASGTAGVINFRNSATAGAMTTFTNNGGTVNAGAGGQTVFFNSSSAGSGFFTNNGAAIGNATGGKTTFRDSSTAASGTFTTNGNAVANGLGGLISFLNSATAGQGHFTTNAATSGGGVQGGRITFSNTSTAGGGTFVTNGSADSTLTASGGGISFFSSSSAGTGNFTNNGGLVSGARGGSIDFNLNSTAAAATITNNGGTVAGAGGGGTIFFGASSAGNATLIANPGTAGSGGGGIQFSNDSTGGTARVEVFGNGSLDISFQHAPGLTIGSLEGNGLAFLGARNLTIGSNNLSTTFSGTVQDGGSGGGTGGSLTKIGTGTLSLTNSNTYTGGTLINAGILLAGADGALGTGNVSLTAASVTLTLQNGVTNNYIANSASLSAVSGSTINLNFNGNPDTIASLVIDGVAQAPGLYGSAASGAPNQRPEFSGLGEVLVAPVPEPSTWLLLLGGAALLLACPRGRRLCGGTQMPG